MSHKHRLKDLTEIDVGFPFKSNDYSDNHHHVRLLRGDNVAQGRLRWNGAKRLSPEVIVDPRYSLKEGDCVVAMDRPWIGAGLKRATVHSDDLPAYLVQRVARIRASSPLLLQPFLNAVVDSSSFASYVQAVQTGTAVPHISAQQIGEYQLRLPPIGEQQAIAEVLGALDDKIAANARLSVAIDELLSADFEREFGAVDMGPLAEIAEVNAIRARPESGEGLRYLDIASVGVGRIDQPSSILWDDAPGRARRGVRKGDTVWSTVRPNRRSHALVLDVSGPLIASTGLAVLSPVGCGPSFLYEATKRHAFGAYLENVAEGSAYPAVRADKFASAPVPRTEPQARDAFEHRAMPLRERQHTADMESIALAALRDALLPELMSGRLHVKDAERTVEEVI